MPVSKAFFLRLEALKSVSHVCMCRPIGTFKKSCGQGAPTVIAASMAPSLFGYILGGDRTTISIRNNLKSKS